MKYVGLSAYAIQSPKFPVERWLKIMKRIKGNPACSVLWGSFGDDNSGITAFMHEFHDRQKLLQIHFSNGAGRRKDNKGQGHFLPGVSPGEYTKRLKNRDAATMGAIDARLLSITHFCESIDDGLTEFLLSTELEDDISDPQAYTNLVTRMRASWPWKINRSPDGHNDFKDGADYREHHGTDARANGGVVNEDGSEDVTLAQSKKFLSENPKCYARFLWRRAHQGSGLPRRNRTYKITDKDIKEIGDLLSHY